MVFFVCFFWSQITSSLNTEKKNVHEKGSSPQKSQEYDIGIGYKIYM